MIRGGRRQRTRAEEDSSKSRQRASVDRVAHSSSQARVCERRSTRVQEESVEFRSGADEELLMSPSRCRAVGAIANVELVDSNAVSGSLGREVVRLICRNSRDRPWSGRVSAHLSTGIDDGAKSMGTRPGVVRVPLQDDLLSAVRGDVIGARSWNRLLSPANRCVRGNDAEERHRDPHREISGGVRELDRQRIPTGNDT